MRPSSYVQASGRFTLIHSRTTSLPHVKISSGWLHSRLQMKLLFQVLFRRSFAQHAFATGENTIIFLCTLITRLHLRHEFYTFLVFVIYTLRTSRLLYRFLLIFVFMSIRSSVDHMKPSKNLISTNHFIILSGHRHFAPEILHLAF